MPRIQMSRPLSDFLLLEEEGTDPTRTLLSHSRHFLERTVRFEGPEMDRAMRLYHNSKVVRRLVAEHMLQHPERDRCAISLQAPGPSGHVIVSRDGAFITCLTAQMDTGGVPVLPYASLEGPLAAEDSEKAAARTRRRQLELLPGGALLDALEQGPGHLSSEMVAIIELAPATYLMPVHVAFADAVRAWARLYGADRRMRPRNQYRDLLQQHAELNQRAAAVMSLCCQLFAAMDIEVMTEYLARMVRRESPATDGLALALGRHATGGGPLLDLYLDPELPPYCRDRLPQALFQHGLLHPLGAQALARRLLGHPECMKTLKPELQAKINRTAEASPEAAQDYVMATRQRLGAMPAPPPGATWVWTQRETCEFALRGLPVSALFPPRAALGRVRSAWARHLAATPPTRSIKLEPEVRQSPRVGRNQRCPCGTGRKYKHCCQHAAASPAEGRAATMPEHAPPAAPGDAGPPPPG